MGDSSQCTSLEEYEAEETEPDYQVAAGLVRDINNILTAISAYSAMLFQDLPPGPQRDLVSEIQKAGEHGTELLRRLRLRRNEAAGLAIARGKETILLVEDEDGVRGIAGRVLREAGYTVLEARTGEDALVLAERWGNPIHLVLTDRILPGMNGCELTRRVAVRHPRIRRLIMSGYPPDEEFPSDALPAEVNHMMKPFTVGILETRVREALDAV